jgi:hypothetical protein
MNTRSPLEQAVLADISGEEMRRHLEWFSEVDRTAGTEGDRRAVEYVASYLREIGVEAAVYEFDAYISHPIGASLAITSPEEMNICCKSRAMSYSTPPQGISGELVYVPSAAAGIGLSGAVSADEFSGLDVRGKIVLSERGGPDAVLDAQVRGALGHIHVWPSEEDVIHEMIATPVWGCPTPETAAFIPRIACVGVNRADGLRLRSLCEKGKVQAVLRTEVDTRWRRLRLPVATIAGRHEPEKFVLAAGHLDSWHTGVTDNATGNACLLELARVFRRHEGKLARSVRLAWWPGHSHGRYAGSTWYADSFFNDIYEDCIAYDNVDSPGVKGATDYSTVTAMAETKHFVEEVVGDVTGCECSGVRPPRAGDQSFWGHGVPSLFMVLSNIPQGAAVGGSGGGWWWHTPYDTLDKADVGVLVTDTRVHALALLRLATAGVLPFRYRPLADEIRAAVSACERISAGRFSLEAVREAAEEFGTRAAEFDRAADSLRDNSRGGAPPAGAVCLANTAMMRISRSLIPVNYTLTGPYDQDLAVPTPALPGLHRVAELDRYNAGSDMFLFLMTRLTRESNRVVRGLRDACAAIDAIADLVS